MTKPASHLKTSLQEAMAGLRSESMNLLAEELIATLLKENFSLDEFLQGLAEYADKRPGWEQVVKHLELASEELYRLRSGMAGVSK